jgi:hypothetical protein
MAECDDELKQTVTQVVTDLCAQNPESCAIVRRAARSQWMQLHVPAHKYMDDALTALDDV